MKELTLFAAGALMGGGIAGAIAIHWAKDYIREAIEEFLSQYDPALYDYQGDQVFAPLYGMPNVGQAPAFASIPREFRAVRILGGWECLDK